MKRKSRTTIAFIGRAETTLRTTRKGKSIPRGIKLGKTTLIWWKISECWGAVLDSLLSSRHLMGEGGGIEPRVCVAYIYSFARFLHFLVFSRRGWGLHLNCRGRDKFHLQGCRYIRDLCDDSERGTVSRLSTTAWRGKGVERLNHNSRGHTSNHNSWKVLKHQSHSLHAQIPSHMNWIKSQSRRTYTHQIKTLEKCSNIHHTRYTRKYQVTELNQITIKKDIHISNHNSWKGLKHQSHSLHAQIPSHMNWIKSRSRRTYTHQITTLSELKTVKKPVRKILRNNFYKENFSQIEENFGILVNFSRFLQFYGEKWENKNYWLRTRTRIPEK